MEIRKFKVKLEGEENDVLADITAFEICEAIRKYCSDELYITVEEIKEDN